MARTGHFFFSDPEDIGLDGLVEVICLLNCRRCRLIGFLVAKARTAEIVLGHGEHIG